MTATMTSMPRNRKSAVEPTEDGHEESGKTGSIRVPADLARKLSIISIHKKTTVGKLVEPVLGPLVETLWAEFLRDVNREG